MERLSAWLSWLFKDANWQLVMIPPFLLLMSAIFYFQYTDDNPLLDRNFRNEIFYKLLAEMEGLELPPNSAIAKTESDHHAPVVLITRQYRSELNPDEFADSIRRSLINRRWIAYAGEPERIATRTYTYCRPGEFAALYLMRKRVFNSDTADDWKLSFSAGYGPGVMLFGKDPVPQECRKY